MDATIPRDPKVDLMAVVVIASAIVIVEEKMGSSKPMVAEDKGKGPVKIEDAKKVIEDDTPIGEGPFDQELGGCRYSVHHAAGKVMGAKQLAEAIAMLNNLDTLRDPLSSGEGHTIIWIAAWITQRRKCAIIWRTILVFRS
jgi:hypothetical protein